MNIKDIRRCMGICWFLGGWDCQFGGRGVGLAGRDRETMRGDLVRKLTLVLKMSGHIFVWFCKYTPTNTFMITFCHLIQNYWMKVITHFLQSLTDIASQWLLNAKTDAFYEQYFTFDISTGLLGKQVWHLQLQAHLSDILTDIKWIE